jgi:hypothetical protein
MREAFLQFLVALADRQKLCFTVFGRRWMLTRPLFGLKPMSSHFQLVMDEILDDFKHFATSYIDDIIVFSDSLEAHIEQVSKVLSRLTEVSLVIRPEKCKFFLQEVELLGFLISSTGSRLLPSRLPVVADWPTPSTNKDVQRFLGFTNYFRDYIPSYAQLSAPLEPLRHSTFSWTDDANAAFLAIKTAIAHSLELAHPDFSKPFLVATDASDLALGAILYQLDDFNNKQIVQCISRALSTSERNYSATKKELLAVIFALDKFRPFIWAC